MPIHISEQEQTLVHQVQTQTHLYSQLMLQILHQLKNYASHQQAESVSVKIVQTHSYISPLELPLHANLDCKLTILVLVLEIEEELMYIPLVMMEQNIKLDMLILIGRVEQKIKLTYQLLLIMVVVSEKEFASHQVARY